MSFITPFLEDHTFKFEQYSDYDLRQLYDNMIKHYPKLNYENGIKQLLISQYIREIWISESPPDNEDGMTEQILDNCIEIIESGGYKLDRKLIQNICYDQISLIKLANDKRELESIKLGNLIYTVLKYLYKNYENGITVEDIKKIHKSLTLGLLSESGIYRQVPVHAKNSQVKYSNAFDIKVKLDALVNETNMLMRPLKITNFSDFKKAIQISCVFFSSFLLIHPFKDGNGRTARILSNILLNKMVFVPFSLYTRDRHRYIELMENRVGCQCIHRLLNPLLDEFVTSIINNVSNVMWIDP